LPKEQTLHIGILSAMPEEIGNLVSFLNNIKKIEHGDMKIFSGEIKFDKNKDFKIFLSIAWSGWGKVSAARAATRLISNRYNNKSLDLILFTGVAGSVCQEINQWDIILANKVVQYDIDARPLFQRFFIPVFNKDKLTPNQVWYDWVLETIRNNLKDKSLSYFKNLYSGEIGTGDKFISDKKEVLELKKNLPNLKAVEMEGCSVAQVAEQEGVPWVILRVISDSANESAPGDFNEFLKIYNNLSPNLIKVIIRNYLNSPKFVKSKN